MNDIQTRQTGGAAAAGSAAGRFPCLNKNISIEPAKRPQFNEMSSSHRKSAYGLEQNVKSFIDTFGVDKVGFLTLTFADDVQDPAEAQRRFNSLRTNFLKHHYPHYIRVIERTKKGRIHYHLIVKTAENIRRNRKRNPHIRRHWERLNANLSKYGFGRSELLPVKTNSKGLARYVGKYIGKHIGSRHLQDKGIRLCQTSQDKAFRWKTVQNCRFQFVSPGSRQWREKVSLFIDRINTVLSLHMTPENHDDIMKARFGNKWIYNHRNLILSL